MTNPRFTDTDAPLAPIVRGDGSGESVVCFPNQQWRVSTQAEYLGSLFDDRGLRLEQWQRDGLVRIIKTGPHRTVYHIAHESGGLFVKKYCVTGWLGALQHLVRPARAVLEWNAARRIAAAGIPTFEPLAVGVVRDGLRVQESWLVTREVTNVVPADEFTESLAKERDDVARRLSRQLATGLGTIVGRLHRTGLIHRDLHAGNVLVRRNADDTLSLWLIDLHAVSACPPLGVDAIEQNLTLLNNFFARRSSPSDNMRFLRSWWSTLHAVDSAEGEVRSLLDRNARSAFRRIAGLCDRVLRQADAHGDEKWRRGNRRLVILDRKETRCRGLSMLDRGFLNALRDGEYPLPADGTVIDLPLAARSESSTVAAEVRRSSYSESGRDQTISLNRGPAAQAWEMGNALLRRGLPMVRTLAFVEGRISSHRQTDSAILLETVERMDWNDLSRQERQTLLIRAGHVIRSMHDLGFTHASLTRSNLRFTARGRWRDGRAVPDLRIDGLADIRQHRRMSPDRAILDLVTLAADDDCGVSHADRVRFLLAYLGPSQARHWKRVWRWLASRVDERSIHPETTIPFRRARSASPQAVRVAAVLAMAIGMSGCQIGRQQVVTRPTKHSVRAEQLLVLSDFKLPKDHELISDLSELRRQTAENLDLKFDSQPVVVYLFSNQLTYRQYLDATYPGLPDRRAYFVGTPKELAVYTFWGDRIQEDLRHEYTHGLLHSALKAVPLWLDEGLAEYCEVIGPKPGTINGDYATRLSAALANGWRPDLERLERIEEFSQMQRFDYQESWAWVHFMLHSSPDTRQILIGYLHDLEKTSRPEPISARLKREIPQHTQRMTAYVATLQTTKSIASAE